MGVVTPLMRAARSPVLLTVVVASQNSARASAPRNRVAGSVNQ